MTKEVLKLALEALKHTHPSALTSFYTIGDRDKAIKAIKEHLAQPEQEQLILDQINYGMSVTQGGKRIDPMSIYKEPEQEPWVCECGANSLQKCKCAFKAQHNEPVAYIDMREWPPIRWRDGLVREDVATFDGQGLFFSSPQRKPLTDEYKQDALRWRYTQQENYFYIPARDYGDWWSVGVQPEGKTVNESIQGTGNSLREAIDQAIEAAHGIKGEA